MELNKPFFRNTVKLYDFLINYQIKYKVPVSDRHL